MATILKRDFKEDSLEMMITTFPSSLIIVLHVRTDTIVMIGFRLLHPRTTTYFQNGVGCVGDDDARRGLLAAIQLLQSMFYLLGIE